MLLYVYQNNNNQSCEVFKVVFLSIQFLALRIATMLLTLAKYVYCCYVILSHTDVTFFIFVGLEDSKLVEGAEQNEGDWGTCNVGLVPILIANRRPLKFTIMVNHWVCFRRSDQSVIKYDHSLQGVSKKRQPLKKLIMYSFQILAVLKGIHN